MTNESKAFQRLRDRGYRFDGRSGCHGSYFKLEEPGKPVQVAYVYLSGHTRYLVNDVWTPKRPN